MLYPCLGNFQFYTICRPGCCKVGYAGQCRLCEVFGGEEGLVYTYALGNLVDGESLVETLFKLEADGCQCAFKYSFCNQRNGLVGGNEVVVLAFGRYREGSFDVSRLCVAGRVELLGNGYRGLAFPSVVNVKKSSSSDTNL